jgi:ribosomal protein S18 acetylase RimI-like enzyme
MRVSKLNHRDQQQATQIWQLFQRAYEIEAQVLGLQNFPPLDRTVCHIQDAPTTFYGGWQTNELVAVTEIEDLEDAEFHINSFGVSPDHFRKGYGSRLLTDVLALLCWRQITVTTAVANTPAIYLYKKHGFHPQEQWTTPDNFQMITLLLKEINP